MKRVLFLLLAAFFTLYSCSKNKDNGSTVDPETKDTVSYLHDIEVSQYEDTTISIPILPKYDRDIAEPLTISLTDYPGWITATPSSAVTTSGNFALFVLRFRPYDAGTYPVTFTVSDQSGGVHTYSFNVVVKEMPDCAYYITGDYFELTPPTACTAGWIFKSIVEKDSVYNVRALGRIAIVSSQRQLIAHLDCNEKNIHIPIQDKYQNVEFQGSGTFSEDTVRIRLIRTVHYRPYPFNCDTCDILLKRK